MNRRIIVLGTDHYNAIGLVQSLGRSGLSNITAVIVGHARLISKSVYLSSLYQVESFQSAIELIVNSFQDTVSPAVIIPSGDAAALCLEMSQERLKYFLFQHTEKDVPLSKLMDKQIQSEYAQESGLSVPVSIEVSSIDDPRLCDAIFPSIIKPSRSCDGDKKDITIVNDYKALTEAVPNLLSRSPRLIIQQFIDNKEKELNILGCRFSDGRCCIPMGIEKKRVHPVGTGSVAVCEVFPFTGDHEEIINCLTRFLGRVGYIGLFSVELMIEKFTNKAFFIELNLRNDALNPFVDKSGVCLPFLHYLDLIGEPVIIPSPKVRRRKMVCEPVHFSALYHKGVSIISWVRDILGARFILSDNRDWWLFVYQFIVRIKSRLLSLNH